MLCATAVSIARQSFRIKHPYGLLLIVSIVTSFSVITSQAQATSTLEGRVVDTDGAAIGTANIKLLNEATGEERLVQTDREGHYQAAALSVGNYSLEVQAAGFQSKILERIRVPVAETIRQDFTLGPANLTQAVTVSIAAQQLEGTSVSVGHVIDDKMVENVPLNGRYFLDLALLTPGTLTPPQNGFAAVPVRGAGSFAINTAGNREEAVNYLMNGITLNNQWFSSISFTPSIGTVEEFRIDNSTVSAEYGQSSGAVVNIASRSGTNQFHGELYEFLRNDALDARNFFDFTSSEPRPFKRNVFGATFGGAIVRNKAFFRFSYEGLRQRQEMELSSLVLSDAERASISDPLIQALAPLIPKANFVDSSGTPLYVGAASAPIDVNTWAIDLSHNLSTKDRLHGYYTTQRRDFIDPVRLGTTIPGFGAHSYSRRQVLTLNEMHTFSTSVVNEARIGFNRIYGVDTPVAQLNPADFGILNGHSEPIGLPQMIIAGGNLNFGGPSINPSGRGDTTFVGADTLSWLAGRHSLKLGGEFRQFLNNNFRIGTGVFTFPTVASFLNDQANSFSVTLGDQTSSIAQGALGFFVQDSFRFRPNLTMELGLRYEWNMTPSERFDRFIVFDSQSASLLRVGTDIPEIYHENNRNFQPRLGFAWDPFGRGKTIVRSAYSIQVDEPLTGITSPTSSNPPLATPLSIAGPVRLNNALELAQPAGLAPTTVDPGFDNAYLQSWNLNVQQQLTRTASILVGYIGSKATHLTLRRNINQPVNGVRPYATLSPLSPILPGAPLGNITEAESTGNSSYNALWGAIDQRLAHGLQLSASYTLSKSLDYNSLSTQGIVVQDSYNLRGDRGLSNFDARQRVVISAFYELPFHGNSVVEGWRMAVIVQAQSGNPVNVVTSDTSVNGVANTLRPDVTGPIPIPGKVEEWFDTSVFFPVSRFGNSGRNVIIGPGFNNTDLSVSKNIRFGDRVQLQLRAEFFDLFNHANFGQPGNVVGSPNFGRITNTRFPTGETGSSRQVQLVAKLVF